MASLAPSSGIAFGFRWSLVGCFTALLYIASCDLFIPPDRSVPRYNTVHGQGKRPALNPGGSSYQPPQNTQAGRERAIDDAYGSGSSAPIQGTTAVPMAPLPQAKVVDSDEKYVAPNSSAARRAQVKEEEGGFWSSLAFWESDDEEPQPRPQAKPQPEEPMSAVGAAAPTAPVIAADLPPMQTDSNGYPILSHTPPVPSAEAVGYTQQRAISSQSELEAGRQDAVQMQGRVAAEAAAEPSLLSTYPQGAPRPAPAATPAPGPQSRAVPLENPSQAMLGGTTATASTTTAQQPVVVRGTVASMPSGGVAEPIRLTAPGATPDPGVAGAMHGNATPGVITLTPPAPRYANSGGYLPESRYTQRNPSRLTGPYATVQ